MEPTEPPSDLNKYEGCFWHKSNQSRISVVLEKHGELTISLQDRHDEKYALRHYQQHTFVFNESFNSIIECGQWCRPYWFYKIQFVQDNEQIIAIRWRIDDTQEDGQVFRRQVQIAIPLTAPDYSDSDGKSFPINAKQFHYLIKHGFVEFADVDKWEIGERNSVDTLSRIITVFQAAWYTIKELMHIRKDIQLQP
ncbi:beta-lactamase family protein [Fusarium austroafricanum]|uniref:Beta-lactamase family protein n=1 Tax=Fusarium austroafricanum TaxID=2364996 RepID=A0A8H4KVA0_9HYPO|nr:beta-lactamase family protein [Fusarium austroafricanum]